MIKVVTSQEMKRIEKKAFSIGHSEAEFIDQVGKNGSLALPDATNYYLLVGKGGNGFDALAIGCELLKKKKKVTAFLLEPRDTKNFQSLGGVIENTIKFFPKGIIVDGLFGIGFRGVLKGRAKEMVEAANSSSLPIFSIDIPSGLDADTGLGDAIKATTTLFLELPKAGFFLNSGFDFVGKLVKITFGLPQELIDEAEPLFYMMEEKDFHLPSIRRSRHKYEAGLVVGVGGSKEMSGAIQLSGLAALKSGAGIVKLFVPPNFSKKEAPLELIIQSWENFSLEKAKVLFVGPGMGRENLAKDFFFSLIYKVTIPLILDADALFFAKDKTLPQKTILTPHKGEMKTLLGEEVSIAKCQQFTDERDLILVLKGAPTFLFVKGEKPIIIARGDPGMATAGSGDVLTGIIAAFIAQGQELKAAILSAIYIHGVAGEIAAQKKSSYSLIASDIIEALPKAFAKSTVNPLSSSIL